MIKNKIVSLLSFCLLLSVSYPMRLDAFSLNINPVSWFEITQNAVQNLDFEQAKGDIVEGKGAEEIKAYVIKQSRKYRDVRDAIISTIRGGQILKVSLPAHLLFDANETSLNSDAQSVLLPAKFIMQTGYFNMIVTGHSDNTGKPEYIYNIAKRRAESVSEWFIANGIEQSSLSEFYFGDELPLYDNASMANRNRNRRITLYFVPNKDIIKKAKRGKLNK